MKNLKIIDTGDGSHTLYNQELDETYHSTHGALTESQHVFIKEGLHYLLSTANLKTINILEIGFGTGLNALLTYLEADNLQVAVNYHTLEPFPVAKEFLNSLNYTNDLADDAIEIFELLHQSDWNKPIQITSSFNFTKYQIFLQEFKSDIYFDLVYFDAFAPRKQPELWEKTSLEITTNCLKKNGVFVTYSAMGALKRNLKALALDVSSIPGPPGKREMTRAVKG